METKIEVTDEDIRQGVKGQCGRCPIALAAARAGIKDVTVGSYTMKIKHLFIHLPRNVSEFINRFDDGLPVQPFSFVIRR